MRFILQAAHEREIISGLVKTDGLLLSVRHPADDQACQTVLALRAYVEVVKGNLAKDENARPVRDKIPPEAPSRCRNRRLNKFEIFGIICIGHNEKAITACIMFQVVLNAGQAWFNQSWVRVRVCGIYQVNFAGLMIVDIDENIPAALCRADADEKARITFMVDTLVLQRIRAQPMAKDMGGTVVFIHLHIVETLIVERPDNAAARIGHKIGKFATARHVPDTNAEIFGAFKIGTPGKQTIIMRPCSPSYLEVGMWLGFLVPVQNNGFLAPMPGFPAEQRMLCACFVTCVVEPVPMG